MHAFSVAPFDQNLSIDGKGLTDDLATLGSLGVVPESIICLKVTKSSLHRSEDVDEVLKLPSMFPFSHRRMNQCQTMPPWTMCIRVSVGTVPSPRFFCDAESVFSVYSRNA